MGEGRASAEELNLAKVAWFVIRARRVAEHSLAVDAERLRSWAQGDMTISMSEGRPVLSRSLPPEEALDSLAARCRPFVLHSDQMHHARVTGALGYFVKDDDERKSRLKDLRARWNRLDPSDKSPLGYLARVGPIGGALGDMVTDKALAYAWLYGDLVHADDDHANRVGEHDINARFAGAALLIANVATAAIDTLAFVRDAHASGLIGLDDDAFTTPVLARGSHELPITGFALAPVGTPIEEIEAVLDAPPSQA